MYITVYNIFLSFYRIGISIASLWDPKAGKWVKGRENIFQKIQKTIPEADSIIWFHCSSLGEFEQGKPILEKIRKKHGKYKLLVTFFSPSGLEAIKNDENLDLIFYLPMDSRENAKRFLDLVNPSMVIFVKYEFWYYYLQAIKKRNIPLLLVSAVFRKEQPFFKWYGVLHRKMLSFFTHIFVQNDGSIQLLSEIGLKETCSVSGDTRFDRVMEIAADHEVNPDIEAFVGENKLMIAGSTWKNDEEMIAQVIGDLNDPLLKLVIAPHEIDANHLKEINKLFPDSIYYSEFKKAVSEMKLKNVLIIDNIGLLSRLYRYSYISYVGGGFTRDGVHNVPEAAVYGKPVMFGPNFQKYSEAVELIESGGGLSVSSREEMVKQVSILLVDHQAYMQRSEAARNYVIEKTGAVEKIIQYIQENRLLTN